MLGHRRGWGGRGIAGCQWAASDSTAMTGLQLKAGFLSEGMFWLLLALVATNYVGFDSTVGWVQPRILGFWS